MTKQTLRKKMEYYAQNKGYEEWFKLLQDWLKLTTDVKVNYVCEHVDFANPDNLKVWISMDRLKKQVLGIERLRSEEPIDLSNYDVREREVIYCGKAVLRDSKDMFVIPTDDNEKDVVLIFTIKLV